MSMLSRIFGPAAVPVRSQPPLNIVAAIPAVEARLTYIRHLMASPDGSQWIRRPNNLMISLLVVAAVVALAALTVVTVATIGVVMTDLGSGF